MTKPSDRVRLRRLHERGSHDWDAIAAVLDAGFICHIGYVIDGQPFVTPTGYWRHGKTIYWHGSSASRAIRRQKDLPVCITVTHLDGLVMARSAFHKSVNYRSVMMFGTARMVEDDDHKRRAMHDFVERLYPGRDATLRPINQQEFKATTLMTMAVDEAAVKIRVGPPKDDEPDYALDVWAGVIELKTVVAGLTPDPRLKAGIKPDLREWKVGHKLDDILARAAPKT